MRMPRLAGEGTLQPVRERPIEPAHGVQQRGDFVRIATKTSPANATMPPTTTPNREAIAEPSVLTLSHAARCSGSSRVTRSAQDCSRQRLDQAGLRSYLALKRASRSRGNTMDIEQNLETVRQGYAAFSSGDMET